MREKEGAKESDGDKEKEKEVFVIVEPLNN